MMIIDAQFALNDDFMAGVVEFLQYIRAVYKVSVTVILPANKLRMFSFLFWLKADDETHSFPSRKSDSAEKRTDVNPSNNINNLIFYYRRVSQYPNEG